MYFTNQSLTILSHINIACAGYIHHTSVAVDSPLHTLVKQDSCSPMLRLRPFLRIWCHQMQLSTTNSDSITHQQKSGFTHKIHANCLLLLCILVSLVYYNCLILCSHTHCQTKAVKQNLMFTLVLYLYGISWRDPKREYNEVLSAQRRTECSKYYDHLMHPKWQNWLGGRKWCRCWEKCLSWEIFDPESLQREKPKERDRQRGS